MMKIDIFSESSLSFIKLKVATLCMGETRRGRSPIYLSAADSVFNELFGQKRIASKIIESRTFREVRDLLSNIDYEPFFDMLRMKNSYGRLATIIALRRDLDRGEATKGSKKVYEHAIAKLIDLYGIRTGRINPNYDSLKAWVKHGYDDLGYDDSYDFDAIFDDSSRSRKGRRYVPLMEAMENGFGLINDDEPSPYASRRSLDYNYESSEDFDEFEAFDEKYNRGRTTKPRRDRDEDTSDITSDIVETIGKITQDAINGLAKSVDDLSENTASAINVMNRRIDNLYQQNAQPIPAPPIPQQVPQTNIPSPEEIAEAISSRVDAKLNGKLNGIENKIQVLADTTGSQFDDVYDNIERLFEKREAEESATSAGIKGNFATGTSNNFVRTSAEDAINQSIDDAIQS